MISTKRILIGAVLAIVAITTVLLFTGSRNMAANFSRIIKNSSPKTPEQIYTILFEKPLDSCVIINNTKDQVVPILDCCIWMEIELCPAELKRIIQRKKYEVSAYNHQDSLNITNTFPDRPSWWTPEILSDSIFKVRYSVNSQKVQTLFFGSDSSRIFLCDMAL